MPPRKILDFRPSEIISAAVFEIREVAGRDEHIYIYIYMHALTCRSNLNMYRLAHEKKITGLPQI